MSNAQITMGMRFSEEIVSAQGPALADRKVTHSLWDIAKQLNDENATNGPKVSVPVHLELAASSAGTIDLTAVETLTQDAADLTGQRMIASRLTCPSTDGQPVAVYEAVSDGYAMLPMLTRTGGSAMQYLAASAPAVSAIVKDITWANDSDQPAQLTLIFGPTS